MEVDAVRTDPLRHETPMLALPLFEDDERLEGRVAAIDERLAGLIGRARSAGDFRGRAEDLLLLYRPGRQLGAERVVLVGMGKRQECQEEALRRAAARAVREAERIRVTRLSFLVDASLPVEAERAAQAVAEGGVLAAWRFRELKTGAGEPEPPVEVELLELVGWEAASAAVERAAGEGSIGAGAENLARTLAARPPNLETPARLAEMAKDIAEEVGLKATILDPVGILAEEMHALLAVARGSQEEPRFIILEYLGAGDDARPVVLVGKGLTFDAGGISIKPAKGMEEMKYDMSGGAAVIAALKAIAELRLEANVVGLVPATENLPSGSALKPSDVIRTRAGKTVEVVNTDAEGRLVLADALAYALSYDPAAIVDAATLTGSCVVALGHHASGLLSNDDALLEEIRAAGERTGERCWPLPLWEDYRRQLDSDVADLMNVGGRPAGTITAAGFLKEFVGQVPWAHLDIAGTAWGEGTAPYHRKGPTGVPARLFIDWVKSRVR
ncbi:MAG: leucyl aminopeptidase [Gemmatimonadetes bacterium]|nr:leucyl aminopeptidase [Gemmatimonadota bacterium]